MIFSEISSNRGYDIVVDGWEMFLSEAQEQMSAMRNGSIRERFIYKLLCCEMDVNTPKVVSRTVYEWCPTITTPAGETLLLHDIRVFQNVSRGIREKLYRFVEKTHPYEAEPDPFDQDEVFKLMKEVVRPCTDS